MEQVNSGAPKDRPADPILTPYEPVSDTGIYIVHCDKGHESETIIDNINFEILFEYSLNAIVDCYYREAVSSFTSAMEQYFEFFIKAILRASGSELDEIEKTWKVIASQSERQLGAYVILYAQNFGKLPILLNPNREIPFRNSVIHKGYIPTKDEAINFGNSALAVIEDSLIALKTKYQKATEETFDHFGYKKKAVELIKRREEEIGEEQNYACVNIMTAIDVKHGRELTENDGRKGDIQAQLERVMRERTPRKLTLLKDKPK